MTLDPLSGYHKGTGNARGDRGTHKTSELAPVGRRRGAISKVIEGSRREVGVRACMPAAAGWSCGLISNDPRTGQTDPRCAHIKP